jgi:TnpA family transposase
MVTTATYPSKLRSRPAGVAEQYGMVFTWNHWRHHLGTVGGIKSEWRATSNRNRGRDHPGIRTSLQAGTILPSAMLKRLAAFQRQNQLDLALQELGRIERTLFILDWLESPQLRQLCQAGLKVLSALAPASVS